MILPVVLYGDPVLRKKCVQVEKNYPELKKLIENMFETMYAAKGVGLAAPQVGVPVRLFIIDPSNYEDDTNHIDKEKLKRYKITFINPVIEEETGMEDVFNEGCLSIPGIRENVTRNTVIRISWDDENFNRQTAEFDGLPARIILHEYDHIDGVLFTDRINPLKKQLLKRKLTDISKGIVDVSYKIKLPPKLKKIPAKP